MFAGFNETSLDPKKTFNGLVFIPNGEKAIAEQKNRAYILSMTDGSNNNDQSSSVPASVNQGGDGSKNNAGDLVENTSNSNLDHIKQGDNTNSSGNTKDQATGPDSTKNTGLVHSETDEEFDRPVRTEGQVSDNDDDGLIINLDGYEGPLDVLLDLARRQKVDIVKISMLDLVEQYLSFVELARKKNLELAADYLVMASWLAYLKTKLLLPQPEAEGDEPTADEMAARLAFQLQRLEAMRNATQALMKLPRLGLDVFPRGCPEGVRVTKTPDWQADLFELLKAYTSQRVKTVDRNYRPTKPKVFSLEEARARLSRILGMIPEWSELRSLTTDQDIDAPKSSVIASAFHAALEFAKEGKLDIRQLGTFEPIYIKSLQGDQNGTGEQGQGGGGNSDVTALPEPDSNQSGTKPNTDELATDKLATDELGTGELADETNNKTMNERAL